MKWSGMMKIQELTDGYKGSITVLLTNMNRGLTAKGAPYLSFTFQDKSGTMEAKYWNVKEEELEAYHNGMLVEAHGDVLCHKKMLQFRVSKMEPLDMEQEDIYEYVKSSALSKEELQSSIYAKIDEIQNEKIHLLISEIMKENEKDFFEYPAATKNHHDFVGGLATHVLGMLQLAHDICVQYPMLNEDLLIGGVILHDIGKLTELSKAVISEYTTQGKLLGHISIMQAIVYEKAQQLGIDGEEVLLLRHMILSHHGVHEYGSPVLPMIPEAEILHLIDNIDARMSTLEKAMNNVTPGEFTPRIFAMENRNFYKTTLENQRNR